MTSDKLLFGKQIYCYLQVYLGDHWGRKPLPWSIFSCGDTSCEEWSISHKKKKKKWGPVPSREQRHLGSRKRENVGGPLSHVLQTLVRFELRSSSSAPLLWCQKPGRLKHLGLLYLICSLFSNCIPKLLAKLLKIIRLLRQIMSSSGQSYRRGSRISAVEIWRRISERYRARTTARADTRNTPVQLPPMLSIPINKMNKFQKHSKILIRLSESHPRIA